MRLSRLLRSAFAIGVFVLGLLAGTASAQLVPTAGPAGGALGVIAVADGAVLGTPGAALFRYDGDGWIARDDLPAERVLAQGSAVYVEAGGRLHRSTDSGETFTAGPLLPAGAHLLNLDGERLVAGAGAALLVSGDGGETWTPYTGETELTFNGTPFREALNNFRAAVLEGDVALATATAYVFDGVYRKDAADTTWTRVLAAERVGRVVRHGAALFAGAGDGVYVSTDGGEVWALTAVGSSTYNVPVELIAGDDALYALAEGVFYQWMGTAWAALPAFPSPYVSGIAAADRLVAGGPDAVYVLGDAGWEALPSYVASSPSVLYADGPVAIASTNDGGIHRTDDGGQTWEAAPVFVFGAAHADGDAVLAVTSEGFRRSADGGRTWTAAGTVPLPTRYATLRPSTLTGRGGVVYAGYFHVRGIPIEHGGQTIEHYGGVFRSTDGGASWVDVSAGIPATSLGPSPVLGLWAVGPRLFAVTLQGCITRLDGPWAPAACPSSGTTEVVEAGAGLWIAHAGGGLYRSTNAGGSWAPAVAGLPIPTDPDGVAAFWASTRLSGAEGALLAAVVGGVGRLYRYDGAAWAPTGATYPASLTWGRFAAGGGRLYGGARSRGVWTAPLGIVTAAAPEGTAAAVALVVAPNPAVGRAVATLTLAAPQTATVALYDALGRRVAVLNDGPLAAGAHAFALDAERLPAGLYVVRAVGGAGTVSVRMVVAR